MPKIRTIDVKYMADDNEHVMPVNMMYDTGMKIFYIVAPEAFKEAIRTMSDELKEQYHVNSGQGLRGVHGWVISHESESVITNELRFLFHYCGNAIKKVRNVIVVWCKGQSNEDTQNWNTVGSNKQRLELKQSFKFVYGVETKIGDGDAVYTYQNITYSNTITVRGYNESAVIIDDTPENRAFLENVYDKLDNLILNLQKFFDSPESVLQLIQSNQKLLG